MPGKTAKVPVAEAPPESTPVGGQQPFTQFPISDAINTQFGQVNPLMATFLAANNAGLTGNVQLMGGNPASGSLQPMGGVLPLLPGLTNPNVIPRSTRPALIEQAGQERDLSMIRQLIERFGRSGILGSLGGGGFGIGGGSFDSAFLGSPAFQRLRRFRQGGQ